MIRFARGILMVSFLALSLTQAQAAHVALVGVGNFSKLSNSPTDTTTSGVAISQTNGSTSLGLGGGALIGFRLGMMTELETGALYLTRKISTVTSVLGVSQTDKFTGHGIEVPLLVRLHLNRYLSIGAGGYAAFAMGSLTDESSGEISNSGVATTSSQSYSNAGIKKRDFGLLGSVALNFPMGMGWGLLLDGRYALGLSDVNDKPSATDPAIVQKYRDIQVLAGIKFHM